MMKTLTLGFSPCPNDTFIFFALVHKKVRLSGIEFREKIEDVETLNQMALDGALDITKISYQALGHVRDHYALLRSGGALGRGCGPLIVAKRGSTLDDIKNGTIAVPGRLTTAFLLLRLFIPEIWSFEIMPFDRILQAVSSGKVTAGLIIHESRFTFPLYQLEQIADLGAWWEKRTGLPIPLGGIAGKRSMESKTLLTVEQAIRESVRYAMQHEREVLAYCRQYSQEMDESVMKSHINLYVNSFTEDIGEEGEAAVTRLFSEAEKLGIFPHTGKPLLAG